MKTAPAPDQVRPVHPTCTLSPHHPPQRDPSLSALRDAQLHRDAHQRICTSPATVIIGHRRLPDGCALRPGSNPEPPHPASPASCAWKHVVPVQILHQLVTPGGVDLSVCRPPTPKLLPRTAPRKQMGVEFNDPPAPAPCPAHRPAPRLAQCHVATLHMGGHPCKQAEVRHAQLFLRGPRVYASQRSSMR
jgi:hypothetical protein